MENKMCISTKKRIDNDLGAVQFPCPMCSEHQIVRSSFARKNAIKYSCPCGKFVGPN